MDQKTILHFYTHFADTYDATIARDKDYTAFERVPNWLLEQLPTYFPSRPCRIIDLGCGTGLVARPFIARGCPVTGVDLTPKMLEKAALQGYEKLICQSLDEPLQVITSSFDAACLIGVMEFIQRPYALFREIRRILCERGLLACTVPETLPPSIETAIGIKTYSPSVMEALFTHIGFSIERRECFQGFISQGHHVSYVGYLLRAGAFSPSTPPLSTSYMEVKETQEKGRGVFATRKIEQGSFIERAPLLILSAEEWKQIAPTMLYHYAFDWGLDGTQAALALGMGSMYNHNTSPNVYYLRRPSERALDFFALRDIQPGEELLINYNGEPGCQDLVWFQTEKQESNEGE